MSFIFYNPNPLNKSTDDCVVRALSKVLDKSWDETFMELTIKCLNEKDMPEVDNAWGAYLKDNGFLRRMIPNTCPNCYTVEKFALDNPIGAYVVKTYRHVIAVVDGNVYDSWDSSNEVPIYFWTKEKE